MSTDNTTSLIVVLKGSNDIENNGKIIRFATVGANLNTVRGLAAEKLSITAPLEDILLLNQNGDLLDGIDQVKNQQVVYVDLKEKLKTVIPGPTSLPFVGSLYELLPNITEGWMRQFKTYGPLVEINLFGKKMVGTNDPAIVEIFAKESEFFTKKIGESSLSEIKPFGGQGLFTTDTDEMDWKLAHKLLMPAFSPRAIKAYQHEMGHITQETIKIFEQYKPDEPVEILEWTTNITFETIGRVGFGYNFNLLSSKDQPPNEFIEAMGYCLKQVVNRVTQAQFMKKLPSEANRKFDRSVKLMHDTVDQVIAERKKSPDATNMDKDLLGYMLNARDEHQLGLSDENIRDQVVTFLIAGHDTTANTLAWTLYELSRNPDIKAKLLQEIADNHITHEEFPSTEQISNLKYMHQVLKETLRKYPPVRVLNKYCKQDCVVPGGYQIKAGTNCTIQVYAMHHSESVYPNPQRYDPDRWTPEEEQKRSRFAWMPFSTGPRGCIGMAFALQEAKTVLAMLLHRFDFKYNGPDVDYDYKMATTKPVDLFMTIHERTDFPEPNASLPKPETTAAPTNEIRKSPSMPVISKDNKGEAPELPPITFLYGTQTGTAQDYANQLAKQAKNFGFDKIKLCSMDQWKVLEDGKFVPSDASKRKADKEIVVICTATYNGQPPDSAEKFDKFLDSKLQQPEDVKRELLKGLSFAVFGLGNKNWRTYQHFPIKVTNSLEDLGAERMFDNGEGDADKDMDAAFNAWCAHFWTYTLDRYGIAVASESKSVVPVAASSAEPSQVKVRFVQPGQPEFAQGSAIPQQKGNVVLTANHELQKEGSPRSTRHIEIDISEIPPAANGLRYEAGDHFEVMPENDPRLVEAIALSFGWVLDSVFEVEDQEITDISPRSLAANIKTPLSIRNMLTYYADITSPPSRGMLGCFAAQLKKVAPETAATFETLLMPDADNQDRYPEFIKKVRTLLDLQLAYPQVNRLDLGQFLASVPVIQPRRYSIASSPLLYPNAVHLAVGVVDDVVNNKHYPGLASSFLKRANANDQLRGALKSCKNTFSLPKDPQTPILMIAAGTGFAPFRGFLQERQVQKGGETVLFFGCRRADQDYIYQDELEAYVKSGVLTYCNVAFSRNEEKSPLRYVQHQLLAHAAQVWELVTNKKAVVYICGSGAMSRDVRRTFCNMAISFGAANTEEEAEKFIDELMNEHRYLCDVWG